MLTIPVYFTFKELLEAEEDGKSLIVPCRGEEVFWEETYLESSPQNTEDVVVRGHLAGVGFKQCEDAVLIDDNGKHWFIEQDENGEKKLKSLSIEGDFEKSNKFHYVSTVTTNLFSVENFLEEESFPDCTQTELKTALEKLPLLLLDEEKFNLSFLRKTRETGLADLADMGWQLVGSQFDTLGDFLVAFDQHN